MIEYQILNENKKDKGRYLLEVATSNSVDSWGLKRLSSRSLFLDVYDSSSSSQIIAIISTYETLLIQSLQSWKLNPASVFFL